MNEFLINGRTKIGVALKKFNKSGGKSLYVIKNISNANKKRLA